MYPPANKQLKTCDIKVDFWNTKGQSAGSYAKRYLRQRRGITRDDRYRAHRHFARGFGIQLHGFRIRCSQRRCEIYTYDASELEPVRTVDFASLPISDGESSTVFIPMDEYDDYYAKDGSGNICPRQRHSENPDLPDDPDEPYTNNFTDVSEGAYYYDAVLWAVNEGITNGTDRNDFQSVCKLHPCSGRHLPVEGSRMPRARIDRLPIRRCSKGQFYYKAVLWASQEGITTGVTADHFQPERPSPGPRSLHFSGAGICILKPINRPVLQMSRKHAFYADAVDWAVEVGVTKGTTAKNIFSE